MPEFPFSEAEQRRDMFGVFERLESIGSGSITPGLERVEKLLEALDNPHLAYPTAIVTGTNGKSSTATMLAAIADAAGISVGTYSSPHLSQLEERVSIGGHPISHDALESQLRAVFAAADRLQASGHLEPYPSYFELLTAAAFRAFAETRVELVVLEVGLGGRLDATNVTRPRVAIITPIAVDHTDWLGDDLLRIATEKFAVVPAGGLAILAPQQPEVAAHLETLALERGATLVHADRYAMPLREIDNRVRCSFDLDARMRSYSGLELAMPGRHQLDNARCAVLAAEALDQHRLRLGSDAIWAGLRRARLPGRCEWIEGAPAVLFDGAHNPAAATVLANYLREALGAAAQPEPTADTGNSAAGKPAENTANRGTPQLHLLFGAMADKDIEGMTAQLFPLATRVITTRATSPRAATAAELAAIAAASLGDSPPEIVAIDDPDAAFFEALRGAEVHDVVCVTGSLYLVGRLRPLLESRDSLDSLPG